jgi:hypothetical protein
MNMRPIAVVAINVARARPAEIHFGKSLSIFAEANLAKACRSANTLAAKGAHCIHHQSV